jgi:hypothetical protein
VAVKELWVHKALTAHKAQLDQAHKELQAVKALWEHKEP